MKIVNPEPKAGSAINTITANSSVFNQEEVECVNELWEEYLTHGSERSGYYFLVEKDQDRVLGYACYGPRSLTSGTFDLFWIAVDPTARRRGVGRDLLGACEDAVRKLGGRLLVLETSGRPTYEPTRKFYISSGYTLEARLKDFYSIGDDLVIFTKHL
jgi:ribosomal protein S18 acetylase RimI-like enzyme